MNNKNQKNMLLINYLQKSSMLNQQQFFNMINLPEKSLSQLEHLFQSEISQSPQEYSNFKTTLMNQNWNDYIHLVNFLDTNNFFDYYSREGFAYTTQDFKNHLRDFLDHLAFVEKFKTAEIINIPDIEFRLGYLGFYSTLLATAISNTDETTAINIINSGADVNKFILKFGNNPLLLAVSKGWNHIKTGGLEHEAQKNIILRLLQSEKLDIHAKHLFTGMTALHIACLRGDNIELINLILEKGADPTQEDYMGRTPQDYLDLPLDARKNLFIKLHYDTDTTIKIKFHEPGDDESTPNIKYVATLPEEEEYLQNVELIRGRFNEMSAKNSPF